MTAATSAAQHPMIRVVMNPPKVGTPPLIIPANTAPMTADEPVVPSERIRELKPFAAAFSVAGTAPMIKAGMEPNARPMPIPTTRLHTENSTRVVKISALSASPHGVRLPIVNNTVAVSA